MRNVISQLYREQPFLAATLPVKNKPMPCNALFCHPSTLNNITWTTPTPIPSQEKGHPQFRSLRRCIQ